MKVLLDTQAFILAATEPLARLPKQVRLILEDPGTVRLLSSISIVEIALKASIGKLNMTDSLLSEACADLRVAVMPFTRTHARRLFTLPFHHKEPFDRMIIAAALTEKLPLLGADAAFPAYKQEGLEVIWR